MPCLWLILLPFHRQLHSFLFCELIISKETDIRASVTSLDFFYQKSTVSENKFLNELVFIGMHVVPAYPLCFAGDLIIFNSIEFWSGNNPIPAPGDFESQGKL